MTMRFEYKVLHYNKGNFLMGTLDFPQLEQQLNELGREGWEVVSTVSAGPYRKEIAVILKRSR